MGTEVMKVYKTHNAKVYLGNCIDVLKRLPEKSVQCVCTSPPYFALRSYLENGHADKSKEIGSESTPDLFVAKIVEVFQGIRRVLRDDGVAFLNLGDSYGDGGQLQGIPWRVALALQADGWVLRQDIIWSKPSCMPESVKNRCTKSHEYIFLLTKRMGYYYDADAIKEKLIGEPHAPGNVELDASRNDHDQMQKVWGGDGFHNKRSVWTVSTQGYSEAHFATLPSEAHSAVHPCRHQRQGLLYPVRCPVEASHQGPQAHP